MKLYQKIILCALLSVLLGGASGIVTSGSIQSWYPTIVKPSWNPPNWIFGPVWTLLYILIGASIAVIWHSEAENKSKAYRLFGIQAILNLIWTPIFFGMHNLGLSFIVIILMVLFIFLTILEFYKIKRLAAYLLFPYLAWVSFATVLNGAIFWLNR
jgi:translocator protein